MVYTRGQKSASVSAAAQALLSLRGPLSFARYSLSQSALATPSQTAAPSQAAASSSSSTTSGPTQKQFWTEWTNWYHAFVSEVTDEYPSLPIAERRSHATTRWVSYTAKQLRCSEPQVRAWLRTADQKDLAAAYA
jgi:hypothetical protein